MRTLGQALLTLVNILVFIGVVGTFVFRGAKFAAPWDGPTVVTIVLAASTLVLAAVALGVALLAVWGYTTLREHAANVARHAAAETAERVAKATATKTAGSTATSVANAWFDRLAPEQQPEGESVADAYRGDSRE